MKINPIFSLFTSLTMAFIVGFSLSSSFKFPYELNQSSKLILNYDIKLIGEELVVSLCSLKDTIIFKEESKILHKRKSGASIICIFDPDLELFN